MVSVQEWSDKWTAILHEELKGGKFTEAEIMSIRVTSAGFNAPDEVLYKEYGVRGTNRMNTGLEKVRYDSPYQYRKKNVGSDNLRPWANSVGIFDEGRIFIIGRDIMSTGREAYDEINKALDRTARSDQAAMEYSVITESEAITAYLGRNLIRLIGRTQLRKKIELQGMPKAQYLEGLKLVRQAEEGVLAMGKKFKSIKPLGVQQMYESLIKKEVFANVTNIKLQAAIRSADFRIYAMGDEDKFIKYLSNTYGIGGKAVSKILKQVIRDRPGFKAIKNMKLK